MPRKQRLAKSRHDPLAPEISHVLLTGELPAWSGARPVAALLARRPDQCRELWREHGEALLEPWIAEHPGSRPWAWWEVAAPRWRRDDQPPHVRQIARLDSCEPRRRLGGIGTPQFEVMATWPHFPFGLPMEWVHQWAVELYTGRARNVHGEIIMPEFTGHAFAGVAIDPRDPPRFESQAAYLDRHELLTPEERRRVRRKDFERDTIIELDADELVTKRAKRA